MTTIVEIQPRTYAIRYDGHALRQHYFTLDAAKMAARQLDRMAR